MFVLWINGLLFKQDGAMDKRWTSSTRSLTIKWVACMSVIHFFFSFIRLLNAGNDYHIPSIVESNADEQKWSFSLF